MELEPSFPGPSVLVFLAQLHPFLILFIWGGAGIAALYPQSVKADVPSGVTCSASRLLAPPNSLNSISGSWTGTPSVAESQLMQNVAQLPFPHNELELNSSFIETTPGGNPRITFDDYASNPSTLDPGVIIDRVYVEVIAKQSGGAGVAQIADVNLSNMREPATSDTSIR